MKNLLTEKGWKVANKILARGDDVVITKTAGGVKIKSASLKNEYLDISDEKMLERHNKK